MKRLEKFRDDFNEATDLITSKILNEDERKDAFLRQYSECYQELRKI